MTYHYTSLASTQIRLLTLHPVRDASEPQSANEEQISCTLSEHQRDQCPPYVALSYVWGDSLNRRSILLGGITFSVTENLAMALSYLRQDNFPVILWVDAVCINQNDDVEKSEQVRMMRDIYANAAYTKAWLGAGEELTVEAMGYINHIGTYVLDNNILELIMELAMLPSSQSKRFEILDSQIVERIQPLIEDALATQSQTLSLIEAACNVLSQQYWKRVWIFQEVVVSRDIMFQCGRSMVRLSEIHAFIRYLPFLPVRLFKMELEKMGSQSILDETSVQRVNFANCVYEQITRSNVATRLFGARNRYHDEAGGRRSTLLELLAKTHVTSALKDRISDKDGEARARCTAESPWHRTQCGASDARDRIFGLLGMTSDTDALGILPNYDQLRTYEQTFTQVARTIILSGQVDMLSLSQPLTKESALPSWVPDWRAEWILRPCGQLPWDSTFKAFSGSPANTISNLHMPGSDQSSNELHIRGVHVDVIEELGRPWTPDYVGGCAGDQDMDAIACYFTDIRDLCSKAEQKAYGSKKIQKVVPCDYTLARKRIPVADQEQWGVGFIREAGEESDKGYDDVFFSICGIATGNTLITQTSSRSEAGMAYRNMLGWQRDRRPFLSENAYVGLAPLGTQTGDTIVLLENAKFPYILREMEDGRYLFIGEAYVHGIMYGEFVKARTGSHEMKTFVLI
jgi:hypothetical protein